MAGKGIAAGRFVDDRARIIRKAPDASLRGMRIDRRTGFLTVVGSAGDRGFVRVIVAREGGVLATYARLPRAVFPNDLTFTRRAVWITDSSRNVLYRVDRPPRNAFPEVPLAVRTLRLDGVPPVVGDQIALNGIRTLPGGRLLVVDSRDGALYAVSRRDGTATRVPVTGAERLTSGDGLVLDDRRLWVVRGQGGNDVVQLRLARTPGGLTATAGQVLTDDDLSVPSTAVRRNGVLWLVNARFGVDTRRYYLSRLPVAD